MYIFFVLFIAFLAFVIWAMVDFRAWKQAWSYHCNPQFEGRMPENRHARQWENYKFSRKEKRYDFFPLKFVTGLFAFFLLACLCVTATMVYKTNNVENSYYYLQELDAQREAILAEFDDVLDDNGYIQLMNAAVPEDVKFLKHQDGVTSFMLGRADRIVQINQRYFRERNLVLEESKEVCNVVNNGFIPILPVGKPDCQLGKVIDITINR